MNNKQIALLLTAISSLALVGVAVYLQLVQDMLPCPLCVIQRYAFILIAIGSLIGMAGPALLRKIGCCIGLYASISGAGVASHQLYVIAHPEINCGVDPVQTAVNSMPFAHWLPSVFNAQGFCGAYYDPILGLSVPQWALTWFVLYTVTLLVVLFKRN